MRKAPRGPVVGDPDFATPPFKGPPPDLPLRRALCVQQETGHFERHSHHVQAGRTDGHVGEIPDIAGAPGGMLRPVQGNREDASDQQLLSVFGGNRLGARSSSARLEEPTGSDFPSTLAFTEHLGPDVSLTPGKYSFGAFAFPLNAYRVVNSELLAP